jgi:uncharacterized membrane protein YhaH (DUF805 family)
MNWIWVFLSFRGRLDAKRYEMACRILSIVCFLPALVLYGSDHKIRITAVFLPAIWPLLALAIKRLRDSGRSAVFALLVMVSWLLAGASLLVGAFEVISGLTAFAACGFSIGIFYMLQDRLGKFPRAANGGES